jgi:LPXTG-motif cell wall-anchored protein
MKPLYAPLLCLWLISSSAFALTTAYLSFEHPDGWACEFSKGVWVCQSSASPDREESVVLSIATLATEWDTVENFEDYLRQPKSIEDDSGTKFNSEVRYVRKRNINGFTWVDSLQFNADLPGFWSRYVATVSETPKAKLAILVTYIVSDARYKELAPQFERMVSSLKPNMEFDLNEATRQGQNPLPTADKLGPLQENILAERLKIKKPGAKLLTPGGGSSTLIWLVLGGAVAGGALLVIRRRRKAKTTITTTQPPTVPKKKAS